MNFAAWAFSTWRSTADCRSRRTIDFGGPRSTRPVTGSNRKPNCSFPEGVVVQTGKFHSGMDQEGQTGTSVPQTGNFVPSRQEHSFRQTNPLNSPLNYIKRL